jgi:hypothetical protein
VPSRGNPPEARSVPENGADPRRAGRRPGNRGGRKGGPIEDRYGGQIPTAYAVGLPEAFAFTGRISILAGEREVSIPAGNPSLHGPLLDLLVNASVMPGVVPGDLETACR